MRSERPLRVLVISNLCPPDYDGGFELSALRNAESLRERGHEVDFVTSRFRSSFEGERLDRPYIHRIFTLSLVRDGWSMATSLIGGESQLNFKISKIFQQYRVRKANIRSILATLSVAKQNESALREFLTTGEYDVAYVFGLHFVGTSMLHALMEKKIPIVYHHGDEWLGAYISPGILKKTVLMLAAPRQYAHERAIDLKNVVLVSKFLEGRFRAFGFREDQTSVIYRGFEQAIGGLESGDRFSPPVFLLASRVSFYKGVQIAIRAARKLNDRDPARTWEMWIAGSGDEETMRWFESFVIQQGLSQRVKFVGKLSRNQTVDLMRRATAVISPSVFDEPFGNTNIEALASGTPLIAAKSGAIEEIIEHGVSGLIYDRANPMELAGHMELILNSPSTAEKLVSNGFDRVKTMFTQDVIMDQVEAKLADVAGIKQVATVDGSATLR